jgi:hypothetical protein
MFDDGYTNMTNVDISPVVISMAQERACGDGRAGMRHAVVDCTSMGREYSDRSFHAVVDKSTMDALLCDRDNAQGRVSAMVREVYRVLRGGGVYVVISFGVPKLRLRHLKGEGLDWTVEVDRLAKPGMEWADDANVAKHHYVYICRKPDQEVGDKSEEGGGRAAEDPEVARQLGKEDLEEEGKVGLWGTLAGDEADEAEALAQERVAVYGDEEAEAEKKALAAKAAAEKQAEEDAAAAAEKKAAEKKADEEDEDGVGEEDGAGTAATTGTGEGGEGEGVGEGLYAGAGEGGGGGGGGEGGGWGAGDAEAGANGGEWGEAGAGDAEGGQAAGEAWGETGEWDAGGWVEKADEEGNVYYYNEATEATSWDYPWGDEGDEGGAAGEGGEDGEGGEGGDGAT